MTWFFPEIASTSVSVVQAILALTVIFILSLSVFAIIRWSKLPSLELPSESPTLLPISVILPTWNEEKVISAKLDEIFSQDYPRELIEVIVIDSASTDSTIKIVENWILERGPEKTLKYRIIREDERKGKSASINRAFSEAHPDSEILMMSDVDCRLSKGALKRISNWFQIEEIGAVTGRQVLLNSMQSRKASEESSYRDFFTRMRSAESKLSSTPIFHGECAAYRREAISSHKLIENANADDSQMAVSAVKSGYRAIYDSQMLFFEMAPPNGRSSRIQKVRRAQGLVRHFWRNKKMIVDRKFGDFRRIMAIEFSLHIIAPIAVLLGFLMGLAHICLVMAEPSFSSQSLGNLPAIEKTMLISDATVFLLLLSGFLGIPFPGGRLSLTFFNYMLTLVWAQVLIIGGKSLHQWQQVTDVRDALAEHDRKSKY